MLATAELEVRGRGDGQLEDGVDDAREDEPIGLGTVDPRVAFERLGERDAAR